MKHTESTDCDADRHTLKQANYRDAYAWSALCVVGVTECGHQEVALVGRRCSCWIKVLDEPGGCQVKMNSALVITSPISRKTLQRVHDKIWTSPLCVPPVLAG